MPLQHTVHEIKLENGAEGLIINTPGATSVRYEVQFRAGNKYARDKSISQVAHIMEHMAFGANDRFDSMEEFSREFSKNGAYNNAYTSNIDMVYVSGAALMEWEKILDLQLLAITKPKFTQDSLEAEKGNVREELVGYANAHRRILWQEMAKRSGLDRWYDLHELSTIERVTLDDIKEHHSRTHTPSNMRFVLAGDLIDHKDKIIRMFESAFVKSGNRLDIESDSPKPAGLVRVERKDLPSVSFELQFIVNRNLTRSELRAMSVVSHILTGTFHSRIWGKARSRGICYGMGSWSNSNVTGTSEFALGGQVQPDNIEELMTLITDEIKRVAKKGITEDELDEAKEYRHGALQLGQDTVTSLVNWYENFYYDYGIVDSLEDMPELIDATTAKEVQGLVAEFIESDRMNFGVIGNLDESISKSVYNKIKDSLSEFKSNLR